MFRAAITFFIIGLVAYVFGASGIGGLSMEVGRVLLGTFLFLAAVSLVVGYVTNRTPRKLR